MSLQIMEDGLRPPLTQITSYLKNGSVGKKISIFFIRPLGPVSFSDHCMHLNCNTVKKLPKSTSNYHPVCNLRSQSRGCPYNLLFCCY